MPFRVRREPGKRLELLILSCGAAFHYATFGTQLSSLKSCLTGSAREAHRFSSFFARLTRFSVLHLRAGFTLRTTHSVHGALATVARSLSRCSLLVRFATKQNDWRSTPVLHFSPFPRALETLASRSALDAVDALHCLRTVHSTLLLRDVAKVPRSSISRFADSNNGPLPMFSKILEIDYRDGEWQVDNFYGQRRCRLPRACRLLPRAVRAAMFCVSNSQLAKVSREICC